MIVDGLSKDFPAAEAEGICRLQSELSDLRARETELDSAARRKSRSLRRKRLEIRRLNVLSKEKSDVDSSVSSDDHCGGSRKKRSEFKLGKKSRENGLVDGSGYGTVAHVGRRREMEDAVAAELCFLQRCGRSYDFYGVYDGHGGRRVAEFCAEMMHGMVARALGEDESGAWEEPLATAFRNMDEEVNRYGTEVAAMGSTAVVAVVGEDELVVANCGDSRAVLCRGGAAIQLSDDHKPDRADEQERIEASGGMVIKWDGARVIGVLATSRSIGDYFLKPYVITDPEVRVINRTTSDEFLILASDGLWDVVTNELACHVARRCLAGQLERGSFSSKPNNGNSGGEGNLNGKSKGKMVRNRFEEAAAVLAELAITKGSGDNVSVVVVGLS